MVIHRFLSPVGVPEDASLDHISAMLTSRGNDYWLASANGWGDISYVDKNGLQVLLIFTKKDGIGCHVCFAYYPVPRKRLYRYFAVDPEQTNESISLNVGGNDEFFPRYLFVSVESMIAIVARFLSDGDRLQEIQWIESGDLKWDFENGRPT